MPTVHDLTDEEIVRRGKEMYERGIRPTIDEAANHGRAVVINVANGDHEMVERGIEGIDRLRARYGEPPLYKMRIGCQHRNPWRRVISRTRSAPADTYGDAPER